MKTRSKQSLFTLSLAIFSMFFGAGNVIFPLSIGVQTQEKCLFAFLGLFLTAIGGPLLGLLGSTLYEGKCKVFFSRWGKWPRLFFMITTLALLGPFAVLPRCVTVAHASFKAFMPEMSLSFFALLFCLLSLFCCYKKKWILPILGNLLSPLLLISLIFIIYKGIFSNEPLGASSVSPLGAFTQGLSTGYDTMDLIAAIYFSSGIWTMIGLKTKDVQSTLKMTLKAGALGCFLLALVYIGLTFSAAKYAPYLALVTPEALITQLAHLTLGPFWGNLSNIAVALACLTTVISLSMTLSKTLCEEILPKSIPYSATLLTLLTLTTLMSNFGFRALMQIIHPAVSIGYPFIILLTLLNIRDCLKRQKRDFIQTKQKFVA